MKRWWFPAVVITTVALYAFLRIYPVVAQQPNQPADLRIQGDAQNKSTVPASVTITTGLTYQQVLPSILGATTQRQALTIQNNQASGSDLCYVIVGTTQVTPGTTTTSSNVTINGKTVTAAQASIVLSVGGSYQRYFPLVPSDAIYATCATTGDSLYVDYQ